MAKVSVIGPGRWGTFLAWYLVKHKGLDNVLLYGLENSITFQQLEANRRNEYLEIPKEIFLTSDLNRTLQSDFIIISIDAQHLKQFAISINSYNVEGKTFILAMKGIETVD